MTNTLEMRKSNLVLPTSGYQLDREEMSYVEGGAFLGISVTASIAVSLYSMVSNILVRDAAGVAGWGAIAIMAIKAVPGAGALLASITAKLTAALATIPLLGLIIAAAVIGTLLITTLVAGSKGNGFRIGVEFSLFSIAGVCEYTK